MTWVMPMSMSSTTLASTNNGAPDDLTTTKSSMASWAKTTSPRMRSWTTVVAVVGHPEAQGPALAGSRPRSRQKPS